jgi:hypothetical protein|tara:strand:- start:1475 stop:1729 length:255 start_codon:yes stop_codon:yes gene_type:complete
MAAPLIKLGGAAAFRMLRTLYKSGKAAKKAAVSATAKVSNPTVRKGLEGAGKKAAKAGAHLRKHHKAYGYGVTGAAAWDIIDKD